MKTKLSGMHLSLIALSLLLAASIGAALVQNNRAKALADTADAAMRRAMYESAELLGGLQGSLLKLPACGSPAQEQLLLSDIAVQAFGVQENLAALPSDAHDLQGALKFVNQVQDYAAVLTVRLAEGGLITGSDQEQLGSLAAVSQELQALLLGSAESLEPIRFDLSSPDGTEGQEPSVEYPTLIYDGPFSDGAKSETIPAQGGEPFDADMAQEAALEFIGPERIRSIRCIGELFLPVPCFEFEAKTDSGTITVCITKTGGQVLYMMTETGNAEEKLTEGECIDRAADFLSLRGYGEIQPTYWSRAEGYLTVNFAAVQEGVLLYPDLVKVEVSMETGEICGIEARNYLTNHVWRALSAPAVPLAQAKASLSPRLSVTGSRLCIIPTDPGEALAWEFSGDIEGVGSYLVYIDAMTGYERKILRLVETETGLETQ